MTWNSNVDAYLTMGRLRTLADDIWQVEVLVDDDGDLNIWVTAIDGEESIPVYDTEDLIPYDDNQQAFRFVYSREMMTKEDT